MDLTDCAPDFRSLYLVKIDRAKNQQRYYSIAWQPTLIDGGAVVRVYGRIGGHQHVMAPAPFESLEEAWPLIRSVLRTRLRHGYQVVESAEARGAQVEACDCCPLNPSIISAPISCTSVALLVNWRWSCGSMKMSIGRKA